MSGQASHVRLFRSCRAFRRFEERPAWFLVSISTLKDKSFVDWSRFHREHFTTVSLNTALHSFPVVTYTQYVSSARTTPLGRPGSGLHHISVSSMSARTRHVSTQSSRHLEATACTMHTAQEFSTVCHGSRGDFQSVELTTWSRTCVSRREVKHCANKNTAFSNPYAFLVGSRRRRGW